MNVLDRLLFVGQFFTKRVVKFSPPMNAVKLTLTLQLIQQINNEFDYIIWQNLNDKPTLTTLQTNLKQIFSQTQKTPLPTILDYFRTYRCLLILDDLQNIFKPHEIAGQYLPEYEEYSQFFKQSSHIVLI